MGNINPLGYDTATGQLRPTSPNDVLTLTSISTTGLITGGYIQALVSDAGTTNIADAAAVYHTSSGTPSTGFGVSMAFVSKAASGSLITQSDFQATWTNATLQNADLFIRTSLAASTTEAARFTSEKAFQISASGGSSLSAATTSALRSNAGTLQLSNNAAAYSDVVTTASNIWARSGITLSPTTANDVVSITNSASTTTLSATNNGAGAALSASSVGGTGGVFASVGGTGGVFASDISACATMYGNQASGINVGPLIEFDGRYTTGSGAVNAFAKIIAAKENSTSGNFAAYLAFQTAEHNALPVEAARFTSARGFQLANGSSALVSASSTSALRSNAGTLELSNNTGAYSPVTTTATQLWSRTSSTLSPTNAGDTASINHTAADATSGIAVTMGASTTGTGLTSTSNGTGHGGNFLATGGGYGLIAQSSNASGSAAYVQSPNLTQTVAIVCNATVAVDVGPTINLYDGLAWRGGIKAAKENATVGNLAGYTAIFTAAASGGGIAVEAARFTSERAFQLVNGSAAAVSTANNSALRSNAGILELSNNTGAYSPVTTTATQVWTQSGASVLATDAATRELYLSSAASITGSTTFLLRSPASTTSIGHYLRLQAGQGAATNEGGSIEVFAGPGGSTSGRGGSLDFRGGTATDGNSGGMSFITPNASGTNRSSGPITYTTGSKTGSGNPGTHIFSVANVSQLVIGTTGITNYQNVATAGWGVPSIYASGRQTGQTASVGSVATYTVGAADGTFEISANINVTVSTSHSFSIQVLYTDENSNAQAPALAVWDANSGTMVTSITNALGARPYYPVSQTIRAKAGTAITITTAGTFTTVTYNVEGVIAQVA